MRMRCGVVCGVGEVYESRTGYSIEFFVIDGYREFCVGF